jgi:hypothetical protein
MGIKDIVRRVRQRQTQQNAVSNGISVDVGWAGIKQNEIHSSPALSFKIFPANGGFIVEFYNFDSKNDKMNNKLYVIKDSDDLIQTIGEICQREFLTL